MQLSFSSQQGPQPPKFLGWIRIPMLALKRSKSLHFLTVISKKIKQKSEIKVIVLYVSLIHLFGYFWEQWDLINKIL